MESGFQQALASLRIKPLRSCVTAVIKLMGLLYDELLGGRWAFVCFVFSQACFFLHFQIGRSALVTSSSSLPSFPSTLSWSRDESARRVKYTLNGLPWRRGSAPGRFVLGSWPYCPFPLLTPLCPAWNSAWLLISHSSRHLHPCTSVPGETRPPSV